MALSEVFIGNVALTCKESDMKRLFEDTDGLFAPVSVRINKRFAFVGFRDRKFAEDAVLKLNGLHFMGDTLRVELGKSAGRGGGGGGGGGGNSNGRDSSRHPPSRRSPPSARRHNPAPNHSNHRSAPYPNYSEQPIQSRPRSGAEPSRYPYGDPPSSYHRDPTSPLVPPGGMRSYSGYPIAVGQPQYDDPLLPPRPLHDAVYDPYHRRSLDHRGESSHHMGVHPGRYSRMDGAGDAGTYGGSRGGYLPNPVPHHNDLSQYGYSSMEKYEDGRYGSRLPLEGGSRGFSRM